MNAARAGFWLSVCVGGLNSLPASAGDALPSFSFKGLVDARLALTDHTQSWEDRGFGKTRYGGDSGGENRALARLAEAALVAQSQLTWDLSAVAHVTAQPQQRHAIDVVEAFLSYKPAPTSAIGLRAKVGAFFPPISLENTNLAWTSPYTISSSAINSWVGEELRTIGAEGTLVFRSDDSETTLTAAAFGANDPAGSLLAWRGWALHDREAGLLERLPLAPLPNFSPGTGSAPGQAAWVEPFHELDDRVGYYVGLQWSGDEGQKFRALYYDNHANNRVFDGRQYAWHTRFGSLGAAWPLSANTELVGQGMLGRTTMAAFPTFTVADNDLASAFLLVSHAWDNHRISGRAEVFKIKDQDVSPDDPNDENGRALTLAYTFRPTSSQRLSLEVLHVSSKRQARATFGVPQRSTETLFQLSYRLFFSSN